MFPIVGDMISLLSDERTVGAMAWRGGVQLSLRLMAGARPRGEGDLDRKLVRWDVVGLGAAKYELSTPFEGFPVAGPVIFVILGFAILVWTLPAGAAWPAAAFRLGSTASPTLICAPGAGFGPRTAILPRGAADGRASFGGSFCAACEQMVTRSGRSGDEERMTNKSACCWAIFALCSAMLFGSRV
jgi:hypothetical protein